MTTTNAQKFLSDCIFNFDNNIILIVNIKVMKRNKSN